MESSVILELTAGEELLDLRRVDGARDSSSRGNDQGRGAIDFVFVTEFHIAIERVGVTTGSCVGGHDGGLHPFSPSFGFVLCAPNDF